MLTVLLVNKRKLFYYIPDQITLVSCVLVRLDTDTSQELIGVVFQNGDEKVIPYISHLPTKVEKDNYVMIKELSALVYFMQHFQYQFQYSSIVIHIHTYSMCISCTCTKFIRPLQLTHVIVIACYMEAKP